jgi:hypothetical protein
VRWRSGACSLAPAGRIYDDRFDEARNWLKLSCPTVRADDSVNVVLG